MAIQEHGRPLAGRDPATTRKRVLVVEDNALNLKLFSAMIESQGYDVLEANNGSRGRDLARQAHPDLIIMDIQLPDISGLDLMQELKADDFTRDIPVIATTAFALRGDEQKIRDSGCDGYMAKPIAVTEFLDMIASLMRRRPGGPGPLYAA